MTAAAPPATSTRELDLDDSRAYGAGVTHGGWLPETVASVALEATGPLHPSAVSAHDVAAPRLDAACL